MKQANKLGPFHYTQVANAGIVAVKPVHENTEEDLKRMIDVNVSKRVNSTALSIIGSSAVC